MRAVLWGARKRDRQVGALPPRPKRGAGVKLTIRQPNLSPRGCRVWVDDHEITNGLTGLHVTFDVQEVTRAELRILVDELDVDAQTLAVLKAHVEG